MKEISHIFRSYDIRGIYKKDLDEAVMDKIGNVLAQLGDNIAVAMDMRLSSEGLRKSLIAGIVEAGRDVHDLGLIPMGAAMFYSWKNKLTLAYITASHLPGEWNGVKFFHSNGVGFVEEENFKIRDMVIADKTTKEKKKGKVSKVSNKGIIEDYRQYLISKIKIKKKLSVVIDCGNGMASMIAKNLFNKAGFSATSIFDKLDGNFPNRNPEPSEDPLTELGNQIEKDGADLGVAYDGDADRMVIVDDKKRKLSPEQVSYLVLKELLKTESGQIIANVECSRVLDDIAKNFGKDVIRVRVGHPYIVSEVHKQKAAFGVESAGHYVVPNIVPFDDALAVSFYAVCVLSKMDKKISEIADEVMKYPFERINFECSDDKKFKVIEDLKNQFSKEYEINSIDGERIDLPEGWILIRASNTEPVIRLTIEATSQEEFEKLKDKFSKILEEEIK